MDLFSLSSQEETNRKAPLAVRMRPRTLDEVVGQDEIIGREGFLRKLIDTDNIPSMILFGPPGTGKTTIAQIIASTTGCHFERLNAVSAGITDVRKVVEVAKERLRLYAQRTILFIDEIHRFNKSQQDSSLPYVEDGRIILIGATTENPYFEVIRPLLSRTRVIRLTAIEQSDMVKIIEKALNDKERGLGNLGLDWDKSTLNVIADLAHGDARTALNITEQSAILLQATGGTHLNKEVVKKIVGVRLQSYDKSGDNHYDVVSAFIKSMRGSDPDAALHYLARMLSAGEDLNFIARRMVICASEDVGNADPQALVIAMAAAQAAQFVGLPEAQIPLAQAVSYIATAPKSNASYIAISRALNDLRTKNCGEVPLHLRDAHYQGAKNLGHGTNYKYPHDYESGFVKQQYLPDKLAGTVYYQPLNRGYEAEITRHLEQLRNSPDE